MDVGSTEKTNKEGPVETGAVEKLERARENKPAPCAQGKSCENEYNTVGDGGIWLFNMELAADSLTAIDEAVTEEGLLLARRSEEAL